MTKQVSLITGSALVLACLLLLSFNLRALPQEDGTRKLWYPGLTTPSAKTPAKRPYRVATPKLRPERIADDTVLGVTIWRLRPPRATDTGARLLKHSPSGDAEWTPVRVGSDTPLAENSLVRLSIEAARTGYLYVIDREEYADGTLGQPYLIFPTSKIRNGNNQVSAGRVIEVPDREDDPIYFKLERGRPDHVGETLTVIVTPQPLADLAIGSEPLKLSEAQVKEWATKWRAHQGRLEMVKGEGQVWTEEEKVAGGNPKQSIKPDAPRPQTLYYNPNAKPGDPVLVNVRLRLGKAGRATQAAR
jgi:hypothetical protein